MTTKTIPFNGTLSLPDGTEVAQVDGSLVELQDEVEYRQSDGYSATVPGLKDSKGSAAVTVCKDWSSLRSGKRLILRLSDGRERAVLLSRVDYAKKRLDFEVEATA